MKKIKIGVFGAGRGIDIAENFMYQDCEIVALCDFNEKRRKYGGYCKESRTCKNW